jgi:hypothetical protein
MSEDLGASLLPEELGDPRELPLLVDSQGFRPTAARQTLQYLQRFFGTHLRGEGGELAGQTESSEPGVFSVEEPSESLISRDGDSWVKEAELSWVFIPAQGSAEGVSVTLRVTFSSEGRQDFSIVRKGPESTIHFHGKRDQAEALWLFFQPGDEASVLKSRRKSS